MACSNDKPFLPIFHSTNTIDASWLYAYYGGACALNNYYDQDIDRIISKVDQQ